MLKKEMAYEVVKKMLNIKNDAELLFHNELIEDEVAEMVRDYKKADIEKSYNNLCKS